MRIAYLSTFYPFRGGIAQFNASVYRELEYMAKVQAYTFSRQYPQILFPGTSQYISSGDNVDVIPALQVLDTINPFSYYSAANAIGKLYPDILLMKYWMPFFAPSLGTIARLLKKKGTKVISILDNLVPHEHRPGDGVLTKFFLRQQHGVITMSQTVSQALSAFGIAVQEQYLPHPIYNHFGPLIPQLEARKRLNLPLDKKILLCFGFIRDYKGVDIAIKTMKMLKDKGYILVIAGEIYGDFTPYQTLININGLQDSVHCFIRYIPDVETPTFFSAADVVVLPYKSATQSGILNIAYHFEIPVVVTDVGELRKSVEPYQTGLVCPIPTPEMFAQTVEEFFTKNSAFTFQRNIRAYNAQHSWKHFADGLLSFARSL